jgi:hypothetical protein
MKLKVHPELLDALVVAGLESSPTHKLREWGRALVLVRRYFFDRFPPSAELGEDELLPATIAYVVIANPPALASNLAYFTQFCMAPEYGMLFQQDMVHPISVLRLACRYLKNREPLADMGCLVLPDGC